MSETDLQLGGGYTYQWECAILLDSKNHVLATPTIYVGSLNISVLSPSAGKDTLA
jgi:DNA repair protein RadC